jgi:Aspartyl protease
VSRWAFLALVAVAACSKPPPAKKPAAAAVVPAVDAGVDHGKFASSIQAARDSLAKVPCDKKLSLQLGDYLNRAMDHKGAIAWVDEFEAKCEKWPRLTWVKHYACKQLEDWACATAVGTALIENDPTDSDYWWWRGETQAKSGKHVQAKADFLQSMANKPTGFPANRMAQFAEEKLARPCDGALLIQWWIDHGKRTDEDWIDPARTRLFLAGKCSKLAGKGKATIAAPAAAPIHKVKVKLDGATGTFLLDAHAGQTAVTPAFAQKAKLTAGTERVTMMAAGSLRDGLLAPVKKLEIGKASALELEVAVAEGLPEGFDGVLGLSALMQFQVKRTPKAFELSPLAK